MADGIVYYRREWQQHRFATLEALVAYLNEGGERLELPSILHDPTHPQPWALVVFARVPLAAEPAPVEELRQGAAQAR